MKNKFFNIMHVSEQHHATPIPFYNNFFILNSFVIYTEIKQNILHFISLKFLFTVRLNSRLNFAYALSD